MDYITFLRQFRIGPLAIFDLVLGYIGMLVLSPLLTKLFSFLHVSIPWTAWLWWMLPISVVFHIIFRQNTPLMKTLTQPQEFLMVGVVLGLMIYMGARNCTLIK